MKSAQKSTQYTYRSMALNRKMVIALLVLVAIMIIMGVRACNNQVTWSNHVYRVARDPNWHPNDLIEKGKAIQVFSNDLMQAISQQEKISIELFNVQADELMHGLDWNEYDGILTTLAPTAYSKERYDFSDPFYFLGPLMVVPTSSSVKSVNDLEGKVVGIKTGESLAFSGLDWYPEVNIRSYDNLLHALSDLVGNNLDGLVMDPFSANAYASGLYAGRIRVLPTALTNDALRLVSKYNPTGEVLIKSFNEGLKAIKQNGVYDGLIKKWGLYAQPHLDGAELPLKK